MILFDISFIIIHFHEMLLLKFQFHESSRIATLLILVSI